MTADDPVLECDVLPLVKMTDDFTLHNFPDVSTSPTAASSHVENVLTNCTVEVSIAVSAASSSVAASSESCATWASAADSVGCSSATAELATNVPDEFAAFSWDNDQFLRDMEHVLNLKYETEKPPTFGNLKSGISDGDGLKDWDMKRNEYPSGLSAFPCVDAAEMESLLAEKQLKRLDEPIQHCFNVVAPLQLQHSELSLSVVSATSLLEETDDSALISLPYLRPEQTREEWLESCDEEQSMEEEVLEDEIDLLEKEAKYLDAQVVFLQSRARLNRPQRKNLKQRRPRDTKQPKLLATSQKDNQLLIDLFAQQKVYLENFRAMLALAPVYEVRMALRTPMESYIRLGKDLNERRKTILSFREEKLDMTYNFIEQKTAGLDINEPYQYSDMFEKFGKRYCVDFAISKYDGVSVFQVGRAIYEQIAGKDEALNRAIGSTTIREFFDAIKCKFMHQRIVTSMNWEGKGAEKLPDMESNAIFYCRADDNLAVLSIDYIDQDDLHPYDKSSHIRRDLSCGVVLSGHTDANGKKFVVMKRYLMAKYHMYPHKMSQEQQDRFFTSISRYPDIIKTLIARSLQRNETSCPCEDDD